MPRGICNKLVRLFLPLSVPLPVLAVGAANAQITVDVDPTFAQHGIQVLTYNSPAFQPALVRLAGQQFASQASNLLSYTLIVTNAAGSRAAEVVVRYPRLDTTGRTIEGVMANLIGASAGRELVLTPNGVVSRALNTGGKSQRPGFQMMVNKVFGMNFDPSRFPQTMVSLDLVIFQDGGVVGPDRAHTVALERAKWNTRTQLLAGLQDSSQSDGQITQWLTSLSTAPSPDIGPDQPDFAGRDRAMLAGTLLRLISSHGRSATVQWLQKVLANATPAPSALHRLD